MQQDQEKYRDHIPLEEVFQFSESKDQRLYQAMFYAFNTTVTLLAPLQAPALAPVQNTTKPASNGQAGKSAEAATVREIFNKARERCRFFERAFSRTLPHSDIARINAAAGSTVEISRETFDLLQKSLHYCEQSEGRFDITMGSATRLWDFHNKVVPNKAALKEALAHVNWKSVELWQEAVIAGKLAKTKSAKRKGEPTTAKEEAEGSNAQKACATPGVRYFAKLQDPLAILDVGGTAKGYIADALAADFLAKGLESFVINLGGNVVAHGLKPGGEPWKIGLQDPRVRHEESSRIVGALPIVNAAVVTSGTYERCFKKDGITYHHILDTETGFPVKTDVAGVSVVAKCAMAAEGYSTTLLALGLEAGSAFAESKPDIIAAYFIDEAGNIHAAESR